MAHSAPDPIDSLYEALPAEFVKTRNLLVKSLKASGQREAAERAAKLTRPTASVWATNRVARRDSKLVDRLAEATTRLQGGVPHDRDRYAADINAHRELLHEIRQRVEAALHEGGLRAAPATVAAAVQNFRSGLTDQRLRPLVEGGRLEEDVGLGAGDSVFGFSPSSAVEPPTRRAHHAPAKSAAAPAAHDDRGARERERERRERERAQAKARAEAERHVQALRKAAGAATVTRAKHESAVAAARRELQNAERALADAQAAEREAAAALDVAEASLEKLPDGRA